MNYHMWKYLTMIGSSNECGLSRREMMAGGIRRKRFVNSSRSFCAEDGTGERKRQLPL